MNNADIYASHHTAFIDDDSINWRNVRRARCQFYQRFHYEYPGPIRNLKQRLVIVPAERYGIQSLRDHVLSISPSPTSLRQIKDSFGNRVHELELPQADRVVSFELLMIVELDINDPHGVPISMAEAQYYSTFTKLTEPDANIRETARRLQSQTSSPHELAQRISDWVYSAMSYKNGKTTVATTAAQALALHQGLCQDYAHIMLSLCRTVGLPARYVSGHLLGEGGSHAWVEVLLPGERGWKAVAFDPTNNCRPHLGYITVAVGRDYRDVSPTSGTFSAPYNGQLTCSKRAGLIQVEYFNGETLESRRAI